jgi:hypothetical protein
MAMLFASRPVCAPGVPGTDIVVSHALTLRHDFRHSCQVRQLAVRWIRCSISGGIAGNLLNVSLVFFCGKKRPIVTCSWYESCYVVNRRQSNQGDSKNYKLGAGETQTARHVPEFPAKSHFSLGRVAIDSVTLLVLCRKS